MNSFGLRENVIPEIRQLAERNGLQRLFLFGSRSRGDYKRTSDIDLAASGGRIASFTADLEEEVNTLLTFDVVDTALPIQDELRDSIEREGVLIYERV